MSNFDFITKSYKTKEEAFECAKKIILTTISQEELLKASDALKYAAKNGDLNAKYYTYAIEYDKALVNNEPCSLEWCINAANEGHQAAQYDLALHYLYGDGIEQNTFLAIEWMEKAAEQGYAEALKTLIRLFKTGSKVRKNISRADYWNAKLESSSYCDTFQLLPFTQEMADPVPYVQPERPIFFDTFDELFKSAEQNNLIEADKNISFIINAGPGTGKTYSLIHKIENLVSKQHLDANEIIVLSFTNAVVKEVKERLAGFANSNQGDRSLRNIFVKTFHSFAYWLLKQANENLEVLENWKKVDLSLNRLTYDDCMVFGANLLEKMPEIVKGWQYFIVDEIQDINHGKARFVLAVLKACIKYNVPYCFLGDSCQAIYDYLDEKNSSEVRITSEDFYEELRNLSPKDTQFLSFEKNHRSITKLQELAQPIRKGILGSLESDFPVLTLKYKYSIEKLDFSNLPEFIKKHNGKRICIMERSNLNTKYISAKMINNKIDHICNLSIQKGSYPQWIAQVFGGFADDTLSGEKLRSLFTKAGYDTNSFNNCWDKLQKELSKPTEIIRFSSVIYALQSHNLDEILNNGNTEKTLTVSNIHRTKGLEYEYVLIDENFLSPKGKNMEEMKVLYVALTRAKTETICLTNTGAKSFMKKINWSGRHYDKEKISNKKYRLKHVEIITNSEISDIGPESFIIENMQDSQKIINKLTPNDPVELHFNKNNKTYDIVAMEHKVGIMNSSFSKAVYALNNSEYPPKFGDIFIDGVFSYIGSTRNYKPGFEYKVANYSNEYAKFRIWNYVVFSGLAKAMYE